jgi:hypothetical protein
LTMLKAPEVTTALAELQAWQERPSVDLQPHGRRLSNNHKRAQSRNVTPPSGTCRLYTVPAHINRQRSRYSERAQRSQYGRHQDNHWAVLRTSICGAYRHPHLRPRLLTNQCEYQVLAIGFLLVILSAALFHNYLTLLVVATYVIAPLPNWLCGRAANQDDFMESHGNGVVDFGRFLTGFFVVMGVGTSHNTRHTGCLAP